MQGRADKRLRRDRGVAGDQHDPMPEPEATQPTGCRKRTKTLCNTHQVMVSMQGSADERIGPDRGVAGEQQWARTRAGGRHSRPAADREQRHCATLIRSQCQCRAVLTSDSDPIEVWLVTNNDPVPKPEANTADRLQMALPPQQPPAPQGAPMMHPSAAAPSVPLLSTPSPRAQASPFFKPDPDGEGLSGALLCMAAFTSLCTAPQLLHPCGLCASKSPAEGLYPVLSAVCLSIVPFIQQQALPCKRAPGANICRVSAESSREETLLRCILVAMQRAGPPGVCPWGPFPTACLAPACPASRATPKAPLST